ncbi:pitrilysin family protein [Arthrobacter sp. ISL-95]|uniref:M16 family metallopeptidase n=1 Tax=Arthrobacter sp. ISL-95 TaxID=2819116 RepID=UPI001BEBA988|nr:insulinase family protein [Arthrobacter sp. ISL-95]MBT2584970.1 insulinase family protein [Arthrobacter sp. ISL-95]
MTAPANLGTLDGRTVFGMRLDTGTRLIAIHDPSARILSVSLGVPAGMRHEMPGEEGMLHLLEHMVYQDSKNITASERQVSVHRAGGILGGNTHMDYSEFYESGPTGHLEQISNRLVEQVFHPALTEHQLTEQIVAVSTERAQRLAPAPGGVLPWPHLTARYWADHPNSHDGTGDSDLATRVTPEKLRALHRRLYRPSAAVLTAVTSEEPLKTLRLLAAPFSGITAEAPFVPTLQDSARRGGSTSTVYYTGARSTRVLSATAAAFGDSPCTDLLGDLMAAELLSQQDGLDASAGLFGPGDLARDDLFVLVDDTGQAIDPSERFRALAIADDASIILAARRSVLRMERFIHDDRRLARTVTRDVLLRGTPLFAAGLAEALAEISDDAVRLRPLVTIAAQRLAGQDSVSLTVQPSEETVQ